ncbi:MAG: phosphatidate cytidylyltransferase, partial [Nitratireductor sp.]|nr:phosphatidate cytidylyltransferase [Nitratireductor sp.]
MNAAVPAKSGSDLPLRAASAVVMVAIVLWVTWQGGPVFNGLWAIVSCLIYFEYQRMVGASAPRKLVFAGAAMLVLSVFLVVWQNSFDGLLLAAISAVAIGLVEISIRRSVWIAGGLLYAFLPFMALSELRGDSAIGFVAICLVFACVWGADTFAYFSGRLIGGPKLAPKISPNKTWSGFCGGLAGSVLLAALVVLLAGYTPGPWLVPTAIVLSLTSQFGDLFESWIKRRFKVKDSGHIIPGHGGILDRIDGLIFASFAAFAIGYGLAQINAGLNDRVPEDFWTRNFVSAFTKR